MAASYATLPSPVMPRAPSEVTLIAARTAAITRENVKSQVRVVGTPIATSAPRVVRNVARKVVSAE